MSEEEMKEHYRSELHRYNLKRKVAGLAPLTRGAFEEREARQQHQQAQDAGRHRPTTEERRKKREERREQVAARHQPPATKDSDSHSRYPRPPSPLLPHT